MEHLRNDSVGCRESVWQQVYDNWRGPQNHLDTKRDYCLYALNRWRWVNPWQETIQSLRRPSLSQGIVTGTRHWNLLYKPGSPLCQWAEARRDDLALTSEVGTFFTVQNQLGWSVKHGQSGKQTSVFFITPAVCVPILFINCACFHGNRCRHPNDSLTNENSLYEQEKCLWVVLKMVPNRWRMHCCNTLSP